MADPNPTVGELFKAKAVTDDQVNAAVDAYLADPKAGTYEVAAGLRLDLSAAVKAHATALLVFHDVHARSVEKRTAVRTAILLARATSEQ